MKLRHLFAANAVVNLFYGAAFIAEPLPLLSLYGAEVNAVGELMCRLFGAALVCIGLAAWLMRPFAEQATGWALSTAYFVGSSIGTVVYVQAMLREVVNPLGWGVVAIYGLFTAGYGYFTFANFKKHAVPPDMLPH